MRGRPTGNGRGRRGLSSLEKVFLGTMAIVTSMVLVMFSLYFDVADMFRSAWDRSAGITIGMRERLDEEALASRYRRELLPSRYMDNRYWGVPSKRDAFLARAFVPIPERAKEKILAAVRAQLKRQGVKSRPLVEMLAKGAYRWEQDKVVFRLDLLVMRRDFVAAVQLIQKSLAALEKDNLLHRVELLERLVDIYFIHLKDYPMGRAAAIRLEKLRAEVARIRALG